MQYIYIYTNTIVVDIGNDLITPLKVTVIARSRVEDENAS